MLPAGTPSHSRGGGGDVCRVQGVWTEVIGKVVHGELSGFDNRTVYKAAAKQSS